VGVPIRGRQKTKVDIVNAQEIAYWNGEAGSRWVRLQAQVDALFSPITAAILDYADPRAGEGVLDVGCGCGATALELSGLVGPHGNVLGVDISKPMLALARQRSHERGLTNVKFTLADASVHEFEQDSADLGFSRFGVMFFENAVPAFANIRRTLRRGGRLAFVCWRSLSENPWFAVPVQAALPHLPAQPETDPQAPGPLAFANPDRVRRILTDANFAEVEIVPFDTKLHLGLRAAALTFLMQMGPVSRLLAEADSSLAAPVKEAVDNVLRAHEDPQGVSLGAGVWLVSAQG
jgi:SAM-dependent methyltransferase